MMRPTTRNRNYALLMGCALTPCMLISAGITCAGAQQNPVEQQSARIWVGKMAKPFTLSDIDGKPVNLAGAWKKHPVVLVFYRGAW